MEWLLLPGILGSAREWDRIGSPDGRGALALSMPPGGRLGALARGLLPRLESCGPVVVVGASLGGLVGAALAGLCPQRVRALLCVGTLSRQAALPMRVRLAHRAAPLVPDTVWDRLYRSRLRRELASAAVPAGLADALVADAPDRRTWAGRLGAVCHGGLPATLPVPVLALVGQGSPWPRGPVFGVAPRVVPGSHRPHLDAPEALRRAILAATASLPQAGGHGEETRPVVAAGRPFS